MIARNDCLPEVDVPEGAIPTATLVVVAYMDADGGNRYGIFTKGDAPGSTYLGLTVLAQRELLDWTVREE